MVFFSSLYSQRLHRRGGGSRAPREESEGPPASFIATTLNLADTARNEVLQRGTWRKAGETPFSLLATSAQHPFRGGRRPGRQGALRRLDPPGSEGPERYLLVLLRDAFETSKAPFNH